MADYWKKKLEELNQETKKKSSSGNYWDTKMKELESDKKKTTDIAPVKSTKEDDGKKWYQGWFKKGALADGYQFGDITKTLLGTDADIASSAISGVVGWGEDIADAAAVGLGTVAEKVGMDGAAQKLADFAKKDIYDEREVSRKILKSSGMIPGLAPFSTAVGSIIRLDDWLNSKEVDNGFGGTTTVRDDASLLGDNSRGLLSSAGEMAVKKGMQAAAGGVPVGDIITGVTVYGQQAEQALKEDATLTEASGSGLISASAEIIFEKLSGGIKIGGTTLDEGLTKLISKSISNVALKNAAHLVTGVTGEALEEILTEFVSKLGTKLYKEEDLGEILFSKESLNDYITSAISGGLMGGAFGGVEAVGGFVNGYDYKTGLNENEQKVFNHEYESRVKDAEESGKKLSAKEKNKIYEEVERDMERGYISTDTIEEVLGGNSYKAYKDTVANEDALRKEYDALGDTKESELTVKQRERYNELKAKIAEMESGNVRAEFKAELDDEMQRLTEGSRLAESYAEKTRRGEQFTADMTLYDEKQKAVVQKAIDSGILNNSNRTHEFVDMVAKISADKGVLFDFTNNAKLKDSGFAVDGKSVNGFVTKDGVTVNIDSQKSLNSVVGHEITHVLEGTELYTELQNAVLEYAKSKGEYQGRYETLSALYKDIEGADIDAELTADLVGDYLFTDADFVNNLSVTNRNVFQKIYDEIKYLYKVATAGSKEARDLEKVKRAFDKAYTLAFRENKNEASTTHGTKPVKGVVNASDGIIAQNSEKSSENAKYSLSEDSEGRELSNAVKSRFGNSKVVDENGSLKVVYHGTATGEFSIFDKSKGSVEGDFGSGFYFTDNEADVSEHYEGGGPDFDNKVGRRADEIWGDEPDIEYEEAERRAREELFKGSHKFEVYLNIENPAIVGETMLLTDESYLEQYNEEDYDDYDDYIADVEQALADDIENVVWEVERNVDVNSTDGISDVLFNAYYDGGIGIEELKEKLNELYLEDSNGNLVANEVARQIIESLGYDGIIDPTVSGKWNMDIEPGTSHYIVFKPNQIKAVTNQNPTDNPDIYRSLSNVGEAVKEHGRYHIKGKDVALDVAPVQDSVRDVPVVETIPDTEPSEPSLEQLREELTDIEQRAIEIYKSGDVDALTDIGERHSEITAKIAQMEADESARVESLSDADAPPEADAPYQNDGVTPADPFAERDIKEVGDRKVNAYMYENPEVKPFFQEEANILLGELRNTTKGERFYTQTPDGNANEQYGAESYGVWTGTSRQTTDDIAYLLDTLKYSYAEIEKGLNAIIEDNGKENNAISKRIEFLLNDRLMKGHRDIDGYEIPPNQDYINLLNEKQITEYNEDSFNAYMESIGEFVPGDIAPVAEKYEAIKPKKEPSMKRAENIAPVKDSVKQADTEDAKIAKVMVGEPDVPQKKISGWQKFRTNFLDKYSVFEDLALKTKNRELMGKANFMLSSEARAQHMIGNGTQNVKSLNDIRTEVEQTGQTERFFNYMYHRHNVDRMSLEDKARPVVEGLHSKFGHLRTDQLHAIAAKKITDQTTEKTAQSIRDAREYLNAIGAKNKPVFGDSVTAEKSKEMVAFYERSNPEFKRYAADVYTYMNHLRGLMVENGVISQETADLWRRMYPHYVPIRRLGKSGLAVNVPLDTRKTGVNAPIKKAVGGNSDIMDMFDTMAMRTEQTFRAVAKNSFGVELKNTLGTVVEKSAASVDEVIDSIDAHEELLREGKNGANPTFTVFEDGKRVTFDITDAMYDALKPTSEGLKIVNPVANAVSTFHKGVLTEYNPVFSLTNAIKDAQDVLMNSRHAVKTYANMPNALWQMARGGKWYAEYMENGGEHNTYFDNQKNAFKKDDAKLKKALGLPLRGISWLNNAVERVPRLAEYIASRKNGESVEVSMLDAARVTTNFSAGGDVAKFADRNGATFLNASIQGFNQQVRNVREAKANGLKGWVQLAAKTAIAGIPALILNDLLWDDDEEYEELSDYVKDSYYIVAKTGDGRFVRIPKGRTVAVIQDAMEQVRNALTGDDEVDLRNFLDIAFTNLAPNNPLDNNILAPVAQAVSNRAWYGEDIVPTRLQDMPSAEQYDESTDAISKWLGEKTNLSPMKINYVLNQYGGGIADVALPYLTPEAERGGNKLIAPLADKFTTDAVMNNQNVSDFYDTVDELTKNANSAKATDEDKLMSKYMNSVSGELSELYRQKREVQNSGLSDSAKYAKVREIQAQIDSITRDSLNTYGNVRIDGNYASVGDREYRINNNGDWEKITDKQAEKQNKVTDYLGISESDYWSNKEEYDYAYDNPEKYAIAKSVGGYEAYKTFSGELYDIKADKDEDGKSITGSRKEKVIEYINTLDADYGEKIILFKSEYNADDTYNQDIVDYLNGRDDISAEDMATILKELGFEVDSEGNISW